MKPWGRVSSIRDADTVFEGQQINRQTQRREKRREDTDMEIKRGHREERHRDR
jgi:hypothetical protein